MAFAHARWRMVVIDLPLPSPLLLFRRQLLIRDTFPIPPGLHQLRAPASTVKDLQTPP